MTFVNMLHCCTKANKAKLRQRIGDLLITEVKTSSQQPDYFLITFYMLFGFWAGVYAGSAYVFSIIRPG